MEVEDECELCRTPTSSAVYLSSPSFLLSTCGHLFCSNCISSQKKSFPCPRCSSLVKLNTLVAKTKDEYEIEKDISIRKKLKNVFNQTERDFNSLLEYQSYQEFVEDCIYNLVHNIEVQETHQRIEEYKERHRDRIIRNQALQIGISIYRIVMLLIISQKRRTSFELVSWRSNTRSP